MKTSKIRVAAGVAVLLALAGITALMVPPYLESWQLQRYLSDLVEDRAAIAKTPDAIQIMVLNKAATLGLPLHGDDVKVTAANGTIHIQALYIVHVDLRLYTVDLHFRPEAGGA